MKHILTLLILATAIYINDDVQIIKGTYHNDTFTGYMISKPDGWRIDFNANGYRTNDGKSYRRGTMMSANRKAGTQQSITVNRKVGSTLTISAN